MHHPVSFILLPKILQYWHRFDQDRVLRDEDSLEPTIATSHLHTNSPGVVAGTVQNLL